MIRLGVGIPQSSPQYLCFTLGFQSSVSISSMAGGVQIHILAFPLVGNCCYFQLSNKFIMVGTLRVLYYPRTAMSAPWVRVLSSSLHPDQQQPASYICGWFRVGIFLLSPNVSCCLLGVSIGSWAHVVFLSFYQVLKLLPSISFYQLQWFLPVSWR